MLTLLGKVTFDPAMQAFIGDRVPYQRRGLALTVTELSWSTAFILGAPLIAWVIARAGWVAPFPLLGGLALVMLFVLGLVLPKDVGNTAERPWMWTSFRRILNSPSGRAAMLFTVLICVANELIALVFGVWMEDSFGLQLTALGASAAVLGVAELAGEGLVAGFSDRCRQAACHHDWCGRQHCVSDYFAHAGEKRGRGPGRFVLLLHQFRICHCQQHPDDDRGRARRAGCHDGLLLHQRFAGVVPPRPCWRYRSTV